MTRYVEIGTNDPSFPVVLGLTDPVTSQPRKLYRAEVLLLLRKLNGPRKATTGELLRGLRAMRGMSQVDVAAASARLAKAVPPGGLEMSTGVVGDTERDTRSPTVAELKTWGAILGLSPEALFALLVELCTVEGP